MSNEIAVASRVRWNKRLVWIPPTGDPYFVDRNPAQDMTTEELSEFMSSRHAATVYLCRRLTHNPQ